MSKLTDIQKLKYWVDAEFTILHIMFAVVMFQLTEGWLWNIGLGLYVVSQFFYLITRLAVIAADDPDYLRVPKK